MAISSSLSNDGSLLTITVKGRFDFSSLHDFRASYESTSPKPSRYIIDLQDSDYLDSSALGMILALHEYAGGDKSNNGKSDITIINCNPDVKKILLITKLDEIFSVT